MKYTKEQLDFVQKSLIYYKKAGALVSFETWLSHALLQGYTVERDTGKMFKQKGNVRTYYVS